MTIQAMVAGKRVSWFKKLFQPKYQKDDRIEKKKHRPQDWFYRRRRKRKLIYTVQDRMNMVHKRRPKRKYPTSIMRNYKFKNEQ